MILLTKAYIVIHMYTLFLCQFADTFSLVEVICWNVVLRAWMKLNRDFLYQPYKLNHSKCSDYKMVIGIIIIDDAIKTRAQRRIHFHKLSSFETLQIGKWNGVPIAEPWFDLILITCIIYFHSLNTVIKFSCTDGSCTSMEKNYPLNSRLWTWSILI